MRQNQSCHEYPIGVVCGHEIHRNIGFSNFRENCFDDSKFHRLQLYLMDRPNAGDIIKCFGGVRKLRWGLQGTGKRGVVRVIYYWITKNDQILFLTAFAKNEASDLCHDAI